MRPRYRSMLTIVCFGIDLPLYSFAATDSEIGGSQNHESKKVSCFYRRGRIIGSKGYHRWRGAQSLARQTRADEGWGPDSPHQRDPFEEPGALQRAKYP